MVKNETVAVRGKDDVAKITYDGVEHVVDAKKHDLEELIKRGCEIKQFMDELSAEMNDIKATILPYAMERINQSGNKSVKIIGIAGVCEVSLKEDLKIEDADALKAVLGDKFEQFVKIETIYKPDKKLRAAIADADRPDADGIRQAVSIKSSEYIRFIPR
ncbi:MAG: hypothetical protein PWQ93_375 [Clostridiales bacterium]|jgi:hypothetical protein|nr:hypothetical protein [Clostridiales bacterium]